MNAQSIYQLPQEEKTSGGRYLALMAEFYADNHSYWTDENDRPRMASDWKNKWDGMRGDDGDGDGDIFQKGIGRGRRTVQAGQDRKQGTVMITESF